ncbi:MAG: carboxylate--amine ligase [Alphaproteobacteria bacterium]
MSRLPPAVVLGIEEISAGLTVVRELGEHGVPVYGIAHWQSAALHSRWLTRGYLHPGLDKALVELINRIAETTGASFLVAVNELDAVFARRAADAGELRGLRPLVAPLDKLQLVNDKAATYRIAQEVGIAVPWTWQPQSTDEIADPPAGLTFPCILKFADPYKAAPLLARHGLVLSKVQYCYDKQQLDRFLLDYARAGCYPMVQSYSPGRGLCDMLFMHRGEAVLRFRHLRMTEWPPAGGIVAICQSLPIDEDDTLFAKSEALLRRIGWEGAAQVEYRHDPATGRTVLMEVNGRFWSGQALAYHAGAPFAWLTYAILGLEKPVTVPPYKVDLVCISAATEMRRLLTLLFRRNKLQNPESKFNRWAEVARFLRYLLDPRTRFYLFSWKDPMPFLADTALKIRRGAGLLLRIAVRRPGEDAKPRAAAD